MQIKQAVLSLWLASAVGAADSKISGLEFMAGCWADEVSEEHWTRPAGGTMLGMARTIKGGKTVFTEYMMVREENGVPVMHVQLRLAAKTTPFRMVEAREGEAVFSNPEHDFPQRIRYKSAPGGILHAQIEGNVQGQTKSEEFRMRRCQ